MFENYVYRRLDICGEGVSGKKREMKKIMQSTSFASVQNFSACTQPFAHAYTHSTHVRRQATCSSASIALSRISERKVKKY